MYNVEHNKCLRYLNRVRPIRRQIRHKNLRSLMLANCAKKASRNQTAISLDIIFSSLRTFFIDVHQKIKKKKNSIYVLCAVSQQQKIIKKTLFLMIKTNSKNLINKCIKRSFSTFQLSDVSDVYADGIPILCFFTLASSEMGFSIFFVCLTFG